MTNQLLNVEILCLVASAPFIMHNVAAFFIVRESLQLKKQKASEAIQAWGASAGLLSAAHLIAIWL